MEVKQGSVKVKETPFTNVFSHAVQQKMQNITVRCKKTQLEIDRRGTRTIFTENGKTYFGFPLTLTVPCN